MESVQQGDLNRIRCLLHLRTACIKIGWTRSRSGTVEECICRVLFVSTKPRRAAVPPIRAASRPVGPMGLAGPACSFVLAPQCLPVGLHPNTLPHAFSVTVRSKDTASDGLW